MRTQTPCLLVVALAFLGVTAGAQEPPAASVPASPSPAAEPAAPVVAEDSPRVSLQRYLDHCRAGRFDEAARYLVVPAGRDAEAPALARRLKAVLDRHLWIDLEAVSAESEGNRQDGLPPGLENLGTVASGGRREPVRLRRLREPTGDRWAFSEATVAQVDAWYAGLEDRWLRDVLPEPLLRPGPRDLLWWQWLALPVLAVFSWAAGRLLGGIGRGVLARLFRRTATEWDDRLLARAGPILTVLFGLVTLHVLLAFLDLVPPAKAFVDGVLRAAVVVALFWTLWRSTDVVAAFLRERPLAAQSPSARNLVAIGGNVFKGAVAAGGVVATLSALGYPVGALLAGLGIGGLAFAFGAQKTVEHLFGSVALATDQPFRVGDFVKVEDFVGTVESIGLRSTRFRTQDRTLITIPNGRVADMRLESYAARDRLRLSTTLGLVYGTTRAQMLAVLAGWEAVLRSHPRIWPDDVSVRFKGLAASSLEVEVMAWFDVLTWAEFQLCRQEVLLDFMRVVEEAGTSFAFPTQTVHVLGGGTAAPPRPA